MRRGSIIFAAALLLGQGVVGLDDVAAVDLDGTIFERAGDQSGIDPLLLYAVAVMESGRRDGTRIVPWPWTVRTADGTFYAPDREAAARLLTEDADVGLGQINLRWHGDRVGAADDLLDPGVNVSTMARVMRDAIASSPGDFELGLGRYHSWDDDRARWYAREVERIYGRLMMEARP